MECGKIPINSGSCYFQQNLDYFCKKSPVNPSSLFEVASLLPHFVVTVRKVAEKAGYPPQLLCPSIFSPEHNRLLEPEAGKTITLHICHQT